MAAAAFGTFSIREYASKMRSVDVRKSWPFKGGGGGEDLKQEKIEDLLPPIVCRKYRWWLMELEREKTKVLEERNPEFPKPVKSIGCLGLEKLRIDDRDGVPGADEDRTGNVCPVCETFTAGSINAVNVHIDGCLANGGEKWQMRPATKARAPKKRSIVEIFAAAPKIEQMDEEDDLDGGEEEEDGSLKASLSDAVLKRKRRKEKPKRQKIKKAIEMNDHNNKKKLQQKKNKKKKTKKIKKQRSGILAMSNRLGANKEKIIKLTAVPSEFDYAQLQQGSKYIKRSVKLIPELVRKRKKKQSKVKMLTKKNQLQIAKASRLLGKTQEAPVFALRSILKNHSRVTLVRNSSETGNLQGSNLAKHSLKCSGKHVRFLGKDEIIGYSSKRCSFDLPLSEKDQSVESDEEQEVNGSDEGVLSILNDREAQSLHQQKQLADLHGPSAPPGTGPNNSCHDVGRTSLGVDLNEALQTSDSLHLVNISCSVSPNNLSHIPKMLSYFPEGVAFHEENQVEGNLQSPADTNARMPEPSAYPSPRSAAMNSVATMTRNSTSQPSLTYFTNIMGINEEQPNLLSATGQSYSGGMLHYPKDMFGGNCSSSIELNRVNRQSVFENQHFGNPGAIVDPLPVCRDKWGDEDFVGLPLNSHGELIQLHSSGKVRYNHLFKKQHRTIPSVSTVPSYFNLAGDKNEMDHSYVREKFPFAAEFPRLRCFPEQNYLKENPGKAPLPSKPKFSKSETFVTGIHLHNKMRETNHSIQQLNSDLNVVNIHSYGHKEYNQPHNCAGKEITVANSDYVFQPSQPTMRLMGKNVTVGKSGIEGKCLDDGRPWTDKEVIAENRPAMTVSGKSISRPCFQREWIPCPASGVSEENVFYSVEDEQNPNPASFIQMTASVDPKFAHAHINCRTHLMSVDGHPMIGGHHGAEYWPFRQMLPSQQMLNRASISQTDCVNMAHQMPICVSDHKSHLQSMMLKSTQFRRNSNVAYNTPSHFQLPFRNQDGGERMSSSRAQYSSLDLHPWLQNGTHQKETMYTHPCDLFGKHHPSVRPGSSILPLPSPYAIPQFSLPAHNTVPSHLCLQGSSPQASLVHHPSFFPAISGFRPSSKSNSRFINTSQKLNSACLKVPNSAKTAKKRLSHSDESSKPTKKANLELQTDWIAMSGLKKRELQTPGYIEYNAETPEFHIHDDKSVAEGVPPVEIENNGPEIASGANAFKVDGVPRLGPIKLSAGAKHILRPGQNTDHDKGRPTHSTVRFTAVASSSKVPDFQEKTAKIYRF